jgi:hypothetical protein
MQTTAIGDGCMTTLAATFQTKQKLEKHFKVNMG